MSYSYEKIIITIAESNISYKYNNILFYIHILYMFKFESKTNLNVWYKFIYLACIVNYFKIERDKNYINKC